MLVGRFASEGFFSDCAIENVIANASFWRIDALRYFAMMNARLEVNFGAFVVSECTE